MVGLVEAGEENDPDYRHANIDIFVTAARRARVSAPTRSHAGPAPLRGPRPPPDHHRPGGGNERAIRVYERVGFKRVGIMRNYERGSTASGTTASCSTSCATTRLELDTEATLARALDHERATARSSTARPRLLKTTMSSSARPAVSPRRPRRARAPRASRGRRVRPARRDRPPRPEPARASRSRRTSPARAPRCRAPAWMRFAPPHRRGRPAEATRPQHRVAGVRDRHDHVLLGRVLVVLARLAVEPLAEVRQTLGVA